MEPVKDLDRRITEHKMKNARDFGKSMIFFLTNAKNTLLQYNLQIVKL